MFFNLQKDAGPASRQSYLEESSDEIKNNARNNMSIPAYQLKTVSNNVHEENEKKSLSKISSKNSKSSL